MEWLGENYIPFAIVFTKADKVKPKAQERKIEAYLDHMLQQAWEEAPPYFVTSSLHRSGRDELLQYIDQLNSGFYQKS